MDKYLYTTAVLFVLCQKQMATSTTVAVWNYLQLRDNSAVKLDEITLHTTLSKKAINKAVKLLEVLGVLSRVRDSVTHPYFYTLKPLQPKNTKGTEAQTPSYYYTNILDIPNLNTILDNQSSKLASIITSSERESTQTKKRGVRVKDILEDEDWQSIHKILNDFFTARELMPTELVYRSRWNRLCLMYYDEDFDLRLYAEWYKNLKYKRLGFVWGLFASKTMREEFENKQGAYTNKMKKIKRSSKTTTKWEHSVVDTKWLEDLDDVVE